MYSIAAVAEISLFTLLCVLFTRGGGSCKRKELGGVFFSQGQVAISSPSVAESSAVVFGPCRTNEAKVHISSLGLNT